MQVRLMPPTGQLGGIGSELGNILLGGLFQETVEAGEELNLPAVVGEDVNISGSLDDMIVVI